MAPPTPTYNNVDAKFTKYEQRNLNNLGPTEVAIAKSMLTRDIDVFTVGITGSVSGVNSLSDTTINPNYKSTITDSNGTHLMINHQQNDLGTVFALAAQHVDNDNSITTTSEGDPPHTRHTSFNIPHGKLGSAGGIGTDYNTQNQVTVNDNSASYYDSQLAFISRQEYKTGTNPDGTEKVSTNSGSIGGGSSDAGVSVVWNGGTTNPNLNAQRAVNSIYSTWGSAISGGAGVTGTAIGNQDHPMHITENTSFNQNYSLYTEKLIQRNGDGSLTSNNTNITNAISTLTNSAGNNYYSGLVGIHPDMLSGKGLTGIGRNTPGLINMQNGVPDNNDMSVAEKDANSKTEKGTLNYNVVYGVSDSNTNNMVTHEAMFFGSIKAVQDNENNSIGVTGNMIEKPVYDDAGVTGFSFTRVPAGTTTGSGLAPYGNYLEPDPLQRPGNKFTASRLLGSAALGVTGLFTTTDANYVFHNYELGITGVAGGGYSFSTAAVTAGATGITIDDNSLVRNIQYMSTCKNNTNTTSGWAGHTVEITNGTFTKTANLITDSVNSDLVTVNYNNEMLGQVASTSQFIVETYATNPNAYAGSYMPRASKYASTNQDFGYTGSIDSTEFTDYLVQYESSVENIDSDGTNIGNLGATGRNVYNYEHEIACIFPATGLGKLGTWNSANYIGVSNNFTGLIRHNGGVVPNNTSIATSINVPGDFTFTATDAGVTGVGGPLSNNVVRFDIMNQAIMSQENSMYIEGINQPIPGTSVSAIGQNVSLRQIGLNATPIIDNTNNKVTDLRLKITAKSGLETTLANGWTWGPETGTLATSMPNRNIFGNDIYSMTSNSTNTIPMSINLSGTSSSVNNRDELFLKATVAWTYLSSTKEFLIPEELITLSNLTTDTETVSVISSGFTINTSGNQTISNLLSKYYLIKRTRTRSFKPQFNLHIGPYSNLQVTGAQITMVDEYYTLESAIDGTGTRLADSYLRFYSTEVGGFSYMASRNLSGNTSTTCSLVARDLIGFTVNGQYSVNNNINTWIDIAGSTSLFDPAFNNTYTLSLGSNAGDVTITADITNGYGITNLNEPTYYVSLSTSNIAGSYTVSARMWNSHDDFTNLSDWSKTNDPRSPTTPTGGTDIVPIYNLVANVSYDYTNVSGMVQQPNVVISIGQKDGNNFTEWFNFKTSSDNATSNLLVYYAPRPVFKIRRTYGDSTPPTKEIYYKMAESSTYLKVEDGIRLKFYNTVGQKASARYKLRGDRIWAYAYTGYNGPYFKSDGTPSEVTYGGGLTIGDANSITMVLKHYRGNSVRHNSLVTGQTTVSNMAQSPYSATTFSEFGLNRITVNEFGGGIRAYYERFTWNRTASTIKLQVNMNGDLYSSTATHLYNGSTHTVNNLSFSTTDLGAIGLKFNGLYSRYSGTLDRSFKLTVTGATYYWSIKNPNRIDQYINTPIKDSNEDVIPGQALKTGVTFDALPGSYLVKTGSGTKTALDYELFTGMLSNSFVAGKVKVSSNEAYGFKYTVPPLYLYYSKSYVGDPATFTDFNTTEFQRISQAALKSTTKAHIEVPAFYNGVGGAYSSGKKSIYVLNRRDVNIQDHVAYFVLPRPQYKVEAVSTFDVTSLPYNLTSVTKRVKYVDIESIMDEQSWNGGTRTERGYGVYAAYYTYNPFDNTVNYYTKNPYMSNPFNSVADGINKSTIYTGVNYVRTKVAPNSTPQKIVVNSNYIRINLLQGYSNGENSTNVSSPGVYTYTPGSSTITIGNYSNNISTIYYGFIHDLLKTTSYVDSATGKTTYLQGYYSGNGKYGIKFRQDTSIFSSEITTISGGLDNQNYNIMIDGIMPFMCLESSKYALDNNAKTVDPFQSRHLDLLPGDTTKLILYGHTYDYDTVNKKLLANIIKYETATGIDFSSISGNNILMKNLVFKAGKKSTASVVIRENTNVLPDVPFNLLNDTLEAAKGISALSWSEQVLNPSVDLAFTVTSLSKKGQGILTDILGTSQLSPYRSLVCCYPPRLELRSADGSPLYQVNGFGTLFNVRTHTSMVELIDTSMLGSTNAPFEYIAYNALKGNAL